MNPWANAIPDGAPTDPVRWAEESRLQVDGHSFDSSRCPQAIVPMRAMSLADKTCRIGTFIKPVQSGGSTAGEVVLAYWCRFAYGLILNYWQDDLKSEERWADRILPMLESAGLNWAGGRDKKVCEGRFDKTVLRCAGVFNPNALNSDTIPLMVLEELHLWKPGFLSMARDRQTRIWDSKAFDISNAAKAETQLHLTYEEGTMEEWETACPVCGVRHAMHFRWNPNRPELGGLRWDASTRLADGRPNYNKLEATIRYQFPCGHEVAADPASRRTLKGDYSPPRNDGAHASHRSWTSEAVSYNEISWLDLIKEWHQAVRALKMGDSEPMFRFVTRRECRFYSDEMRPFSGAVVTTTEAVQNREGLPGELCKMWSADWQQGFKAAGELTHYWLVIESVLPNCSSQVIFEGKISDESELLSTLEAHGITNKDNGGLFDGFIDASKNQKAILSFCYRAGINAVVGGAHGKGGFRHPDGSWRFYSPKKFIYTQLGITYERARQDHPDWFTENREGQIVEGPNCPFVLEYDKAGLLKNYFFIREMKLRVLESNPKATALDYVERVVPSDVGDDYLKHHEAWERDLKFTRGKNTGEVEGFKQLSRIDHLMSCTTQIDLLKEFSGLLGRRLAELAKTP